MARNYDYNGDPCGEFGAAVRVVGQLREELARLRLTDEEREAVGRAAMLIDDTVIDDSDLAMNDYQALRGLYERTQ